MFFYPNEGAVCRNGFSRYVPNLYSKSLEIMKKEQILSIIRHTLTFVGGVLITKGLIDEGMVNELSGASLTLIGGIWAIIDKNKK